MTIQDRPPPPASTAVGRGSRWLLLAAAAWLVAGLQLDAWAHATIPDLETFWTPWHAVLYSGIAACGGVLAWQTHRLLPAGNITLGSVAALPLAFRIPAAGMALLLVGGGIDTLWHNIFGIERELEIFVSPSHILIITGMCLVASGPALMRAAEPDDGRLAPSDAVLVLASTLLAVLPLHIFSVHASAIGWPHLGSGQVPMRITGSDALAVHGYATSTVLLLAPLLAIGRRWRLPLGVGPVLTGVPAVALWVVFDKFENTWYPVALVLAAVLTEVVLRAGSRLVAGLPADGRWVAFGAAAPALMWSAVLAAGAAVAAEPYGWNIHTTTGIVTMTALAGALTALVVRRIR